MGNKLFISGIFVAAAYLFYDTFFFQKNLIARTSSPEGMPRIVLASIMLIALLMFARDYRKAIPSRVSCLFQGTRLYVLIALPLYLLALPWLGFTVSTFLSLVVLFDILSPEKTTLKSLLLNTLLAACLAGCTFFVFRQLFYIQLPVNIFDF
ncbi:MAG: tripartite tricarboxylate transporter TctB family protein [Desulfovibrionaceae bacterium]|nr:tripartite tricarboxylate transporter TctB family protein [Desulfovibrionaceae bacterium]